TQRFRSPNDLRAQRTGPRDQVVREVRQQKPDLQVEDADAQHRKITPSPHFRTNGSWGLYNQSPKGKPAFPPGDYFESPGRWSSKGTCGNYFTSCGNPKNL